MLEEYTKDFPFKPFDKKGNKIELRDKVKILHIPDWLLNGLDEESINAVKACEGDVMRVDDIDEYGYIWVGITVLEIDDKSEGHMFIMEPKNLLKII